MSVRPTSAPTISLCMIVRNEAHFIADCLDSARPHVDEMVVVDTGSVDGTRALAAAKADAVDDFTWCDDFSAARNHGLGLATSDWILVLDADERIAGRDYARLRVAADTHAVDGFFLEQRNYNDEPLGAGWQPVPTGDPLSRRYRGYRPNPILRLFRRRPDIRFAGRIHETVDASVAADRSASLDVAIHHYMDEDPTKPYRERQLRYLALIEAELKVRPSGRLYSQAAGVRMYHLQDYDTAAQQFLEAAQLGERPAQSLEGAAEACYRAGRLGQALSLYERVALAGTDRPSAYSNMANLLVRAERYPEAIDALEKALELDAGNTDRRQRLQVNIEALRAMADERKS